MHAARSWARASCNSSAAGREATRGPACGLETAVTSASPRDHVGRKVVDLPGDVLAEQIVERQQVIKDLQVVRRVRDVLRQQLAEQTAIRIAHRERGGLLELQPGRLELDGVHAQPGG